MVRTRRPLHSAARPRPEEHPRVRPEPVDGIWFSPLARTPSGAATRWLTPSLPGAERRCLEGFACLADAGCPWGRLAAALRSEHARWFWYVRATGNPSPAGFPDLPASASTGCPLSRTQATEHRLWGQLAVLGGSLVSREGSSKAGSAGRTRAAHASANAPERPALTCERSASQVERLVRRPRRRCSEAA